MNVLILMIPMSILLGVGFVTAFLWANNHGQFDDLETPAHRMLKENDSSIFNNHKERKDV
ncbi:MAG: cbb3-type cytochrome oxidase assembly protein CcoS [Bdellovibrionaceae bacterium]|nr:cbb3-type cytochrome oxidase assembly protein CcoS [Pseudobdellovibrionaceae bacterium]